MKGEIVRRTFSIPKDLKEKLDKFPEVNWSEVAKQVILRKLKKLKELQARGEL